jgi:hypothetical protein
MRNIWMALATGIANDALMSIGAPASGISGQSGRIDDRIAERPSHGADGRRDSLRRSGRAKP